MKKLMLLTCATVLISTSSTFSAASPSLNATQCKLGELCTIPDGIGKIAYIPVTSEKASGVHYTCVLHSLDKSSTITTFFSSHGDFKFDSQKVSADTSGKTVLIDGKFTKNNAKGEIRIRNITITPGSVQCTKD